MTDGAEQMVQDYLAFIEIRERIDVERRVDLTSFVHLRPSTALPLLVYLKVNGANLDTAYPLDAKVKAFLRSILNGWGVERLQIYGRSMVLSLPKHGSVFLDQAGDISRFGGDIGGPSAFRYLIGELVDNVYQHSGFDSAFVMVIKNPTDGRVYLSIIDDGVSLSGSYLRIGMVLEDHDAIELAVQGLSSKPSIERGMGL